MTPDGMPIIDYSPKHDNLVIAAGHNMQGMGMSPVTGALVQQLISGEDVSMEMSYYSAKRF
jgi:glycine/D-amino acid oxidase-like deaminating enzyme